MEFRRVENPTPGVENEAARVENLSPGVENVAARVENQAQGVEFAIFSTKKALPVAEYFFNFPGVENEALEWKIYREE